MRKEPDGRHAFLGAPAWVWLAAALPRLALWGLAVIDPHRCLRADSTGYLDLAGNLLHQRAFGSYEAGRWAAETSRTPAYPLWLAACAALHNDPALLASLLQCLLGTLTVALCWRWFEGLGGRKGAATGVLFLALDPVSVFHTPLLLSETLFVLFLVLSMLKVWTPGKGWGRAAIGGLLWGVTSLFRPISLYLPPLLCWRWWPDRKAMAAFMAAACLLPAAWVLRNQAVTGHAVFSSLPGVDLLRYPAAGVESLRTGRRLKELDLELRQEIDSAHPAGYSSQAEQAKIYGRRAGEILRAHPLLLLEYCAWGTVKVLAGTGLEMWLEWTSADTPGPEAAEFKPKASGQGTLALLRAHPWLIPIQLLYWMFLAALYGLALTGLLKLWHGERRAEALLLGGCAAYFLALSSLEGYYRYRIPMMPFLAAAAAAFTRNAGKVGKGQAKQDEWSYQWSVFEDNETQLFRDWIQPNRLEDFAGKLVLDAGCGPGHHARLAAALAREVVAVDLNTADIARKKLADLPNVRIVEADISSWDDGNRFDVVYCVGVVHHTADPDRTVSHLKDLLKPGGRMILWVYAREGNALNRWLLEPAKEVILHRLARPVLSALSHLATLALYPPVFTLYLLPLSFLPFHEYFHNFRTLSYKRNQLNVFDKMNAPTTHFISRTQAESWLSGLEDTHLSPYVGVSWRVSGRKPTIP